MSLPKPIGWCARHQRVLDTANFSNGQLHRRGGLCLDCMRTRRRRPRDRWWSLLSQAKHRGIHVSITYSEFEIIVSQPCAYGSSRNVGIDRVDNQQGYVVGNCVPCCYKHNLLKGSYFTFEEMRKIVATIDSARDCGDRNVGD